MKVRSIRKDCSVCLYPYNVRTSLFLSKALSVNTYNAHDFAQLNNYFLILLLIERQTYL